MPKYRTILMDLRSLYKSTKDRNSVEINPEVLGKIIRLIDAVNKVSLTNMDFSKVINTAKFFNEKYEDNLDEN